MASRDDIIDMIMRLPPSARATAWIKFHECRKKFDKRKGTMANLVKVATYRATIDEKRKHRREKPTEELDNFIAKASESDSTECLDKIAELLSAVPYGNLLLERCYLNRNVAELARLHKVSESVIMTRISRVRSMVRRLMADS